MSHFSEMKTCFNNIKVLKEALKALGHTIEDATEKVEVRGFFGESVEADFKILTKTHYDIGFKQGLDGSYEIVGDWELLPKVSGIEQEEFNRTLKKEYAKQAVIAVAKENGYQIEVQESEGTYEMVVTQW